MRIIVLALILLVFPFNLVGQPINVLNDSSTIGLKYYAAMPDRGYSLEKILADSTLPFITADSLRPSKNNTYWLKISITNESHYDKAYYIKVSPKLNNTLYFFDADTRKWTDCPAGILVATDHSRNKGMMRITFRGQLATVLFIKIKIPFPKFFTRPIKPGIWLEKETAIAKQETFLWIAWITTLSILLIFFFNNIHVYFSFRDRTVLYFLIAQFGGILYITSFRSFFEILFFSPPCTLQLFADGTMYDYNLNSILMHFSVLLVMFGFVQSTRYYLNTPKRLPKFDAIFKYGLIIYCILSVVVMLINCFIFYLDSYTLLYENIFIMFLLGAVIATGVICGINKLPDANNFLLANMLPLLFMLALAGYNVFIGFQSNAFLLLPDLAIVSQAICFSVAIVARIRHMRDLLAVKEMEVQHLFFDIEKMGLNQQLIELENEQINNEIREMESRQRLIELEKEQINANMEQEKNKNEDLQEKLEANQRKLASSTLYIVQKNKMLATLKTEIEQLVKHIPESKQNGLQGIQSILKSNLYLDADWEKFKLHFEQVHPHFFEELQAKHPSLTKNELRLYAYFYINLSAKEIAALLNIDPTSVHRAKTRLNKKMAET